MRMQHACPLLPVTLQDCSLRSAAGRGLACVVCDCLQGHLEGVLHDLDPHLLVKVGQLLLQAVQPSAGVQQRNPPACTVQTVLESCRQTLHALA